MSIGLRFFRNLSVSIFVALFVWLPLSLFVAPKALAQSEWVILPVGDASTASGLEAQVRGELENAGIAVMRPEAAANVFRERVSSPAQSLSQGDIDAWAERSRSALEALARADYDSAREQLLEAQRVARLAAEELNREADRARQVLDTCLFMARTFLETGDRTQAIEQVRSCRALAPQVEPRRHRHTPEVHELLEEVDAEPAQGTLRVDSSPSGCVVRVNGVAQGVSPFRMATFTRADYRVQVECSNERARVHRARMADGNVELHVFPAFDAEVRSEPTLRLEAGATPTDAMIAEVARRLGTTVVLTFQDDGVRYLVRVQPDGEVTRSDSRNSDLVNALLQARSAESDEEPTDQMEVASSGALVGLPGWRIGIGTTLVLAGAGGIVLGVMLHRKRVENGNFYREFTTVRSGFLENQQLWLDRTTLSVAVPSLIGGVIGGLGAALLVRSRDHVAWWNWLIGGAGVALAASSLIPLITRPTCEDVRDPTNNRHADCIDRSLAGDVASLIGSAAIPLIAVPISALIQRRSDTRVSASFVPVFAGGMLQLGGQF